MYDKNSLDSLLEAYEKSFLMKLKEKTSYYTHKLVKKTFPYIIYGGLGLGIGISFNLFENKEFFFANNIVESKKTEHFMKGKIIGDTRMQYTIYFKDKTAFEEINRFVIECQRNMPHTVPWVTESRNREYLVFHARPDSMRRALKENSFDSSMVFSNYKVKSASHEMQNFVVSKDGKEFFQVYDSKELQMFPTWSRNDKQIGMMLAKVSKNNTAETERVKVNLKTNKAKKIPLYLDDLIKSVPEEYLHWLGLGIGLSTFYALRKKRKDKNVSLIRSVRDHIQMINIGATGLTTNYIFSNMYFYQTDWPVNIPFALPAIAAVGYVCTSTFLGAMFGLTDNLKEINLKNVAKKTYLDTKLTFTDNPDAKIKLIHKIQDLVEDPNVYKADLANELGKKGEQTKKSNMYKEALSHNISRTMDLNYFSRFALVPIANLMDLYVEHVQNNKIKAKQSSLLKDLLFKDYIPALKKFSTLTNPEENNSELGRNQPELNGLFALTIDYLSAHLEKNLFNENLESLSQLKSYLETQTSFRGDLSELLNHRSYEQWLKTIELILNNSQASFNSLGGYNVYSVGPNEFLSEQILFKENNTSQPLIEEKIIAELMKEIVPESTPNPITVTRTKEERHFYVMTRASGETLLNLILKNKVPNNTYHQIMDELSKIHLTLSQKITKASMMQLSKPIELKPYDFGTKLEEKVVQAGFNFEIIQAIKPTIQLLEHSPNIGYNKDAWTENWIINEEDENLMTMICDTENRGTIPKAVDLAHLLNFIPYEDFDMRNMRALEYTTLHNNNQSKLKEGFPIENELEFMNEYYHGTIYRAIANTGYLESKGRTELVPLVAQTGIEMIDFMMKEGMLQNMEPNYKFIKEQLQTKI